MRVCERVRTCERQLVTVISARVITHPPHLSSNTTITTSVRGISHSDCKHASRDKHMHPLRSADRRVNTADYIQHKQAWHAR